jgi:hypothetical protein
MAKAKTKNTNKKPTKKTNKKEEYNSADKKAFRESEEWKNFRKEKFEETKVDYITQRRLQSRANLHHLDLSSENYEDLSHPENFILLNKHTHQMIHMLYTYYKNDPWILDRIKEVLDRMVELNN